MLLYLLTVLTSLGIIIVLPVVLLVLGIQLLRGRRKIKPFLVATTIGVAFVFGCLLGWNFRPFYWSLSFRDTLLANTAAHSLERDAERVLLFVLMTGSAGAWLVAVLSLAAQWRHRLGWAALRSGAPSDPGRPTSHPH